MNKCIAIGHHDFEEIRTKNLYYVDKTDFIRRLDASNHKIYLFPRPRRFGKTLNMMLLRRYFEISETSKGSLPGVQRDAFVALISGLSSEL